MNKTTQSKSGKVIATYTTTATKRDLDEVVADVLKTIKPAQKITVTVQ